MHLATVPELSPPLQSTSIALPSAAAPTLQIELAGTTPGTQYDQLHVTGQLSLGGELQVVTLPGFTPSLGNSFDIMDWGTLSGKFSELSLPSLSTGLSWSTLQLYTTGTLRVANSTLLFGDFNRDGVVTAADIAIRQTCWPICKVMNRDTAA